MRIEAYNQVQQIYSNSKVNKAQAPKKTNDVRDVFWPPDDMKLRSSMTLFAYISEDDSVFQKVLDKYFDGIQDWRTLKALKNQDVNRGW